MRPWVRGVVGVGSAIACGIGWHLWGALSGMLTDQALAEVSVTPTLNQVLPRSAAMTVRRTFRRDYGHRVSNVRVTSAQPIVWEDCPPDRPNGRYSYQPCERRSRSGWRVIVSGEFEALGQSISRVYYTDGAEFPWGDRRRFAMLDPVSSLTDTQLAQLATQANQPLEQLNLIAAQEESFYPATACPTQGVCPISPLALGWRVLVQQGSRERIMRVASLGAPPNSEVITAFLSESDRPTLGTLPVALGNAVMGDAYERFTTGEFYPDPYPETGVEVEFRLDSVQSITWNLCHGGEGPSRAAMGICPNVNVSGWRIVVVGGLKQDPFRLVYYIPHDVAVDSFNPTPDGLQSLPAPVQTRILQTISEQAEVPVSEMRLHWAEAKLFDRCLGVESQEILCHTEIRPGWLIEVLANSSVLNSTWGQAHWVYHANLTGSDVRLVRRGVWAPPP